MNPPIPKALEAVDRTAVGTGPRLARWLPLLLVICAFAYYGSYLRCWFNSHDEGGTAVLLAQRLLAGERPIVDVQIGYNVGWFYPLVALFKFTGPDYLLTRAWFFLLSTCGALAAFRLLRLVTGRPWLAFAVGLLLIVFPGSQFKNYIPMLALLNTCTLVQAMLRQDRRSLGGFALDALWGGLALGLAFLIRIELGIFFTLLWLGALAWLWLDHGRRAGEKAARSGLAVAVLAASIVALHLPVYLDAQRRGFGAEFLAEYPRTMRDLASDASRELGMQQPKPMAAGTATPKPRQPRIDRTTLPRSPVPAIWSSKDLQPRALAFLTYAPLLAYVALLLWCAVRIIQLLRAREFGVGRPAFLSLLALGGSLTTFPQFFSFRPDRPHLSEFMPCYMVAIAISLWALWREPRGGLGTVWRGALSFFLAAQIGIFAWFALQHPSAGTIAAREKRKLPFDGANGVHVLLQKKELKLLEAVRRTIVENSKPGEYLICYPYQPGFNVMTDRPTYLENVYIDNATQTRSWPRTTIADIERHRPAVVIIDDRAINKVDISRFSRWAAPVYEYVRAHYHRRDEHFGDQETTLEIYALTPKPAP